MRYTIDRKKDKPAYMQLYYQLRKDIVGGAYPYMTKLPSKRLISEESGISVITVEHAYGILCDEGYVEPRERSGYFVSYNEKFSVPVPEETRTELSAVRGGRGAEAAFPFSVMARVMRRVLSERGESILVKSPNDGCPELRRAIAAYLVRSRGIHVLPSQVIIGSGAEYLYGLTVRLFGRERVFALEDPCYEMIPRVYEANGVRTDRLRLGSEGIKSSELERTEATVLHVTPFCSFPSGITASASKRREYIRWAQTRGAFIVEDDFASEFTVSTKAEDTLFSLEPCGHVVYMNTFSKTVAPSLRVGYMVLPESLLVRYRECAGFYSCTVPIFEQYVLAELIDGGDFERHINRVRRGLRKLSAAKEPEKQER
ncbi:MAG: PLP-dependent aminotransferase family protein [Clostridiales bacterium]|nr:PLP-dependent aminotransferase family protein [Clostridiales bacterium]